MVFSTYFQCTVSLSPGIVGGLIVSALRIATLFVDSFLDVVMHMCVFAARGTRRRGGHALPIGFSRLCQNASSTLHPRAPRPIALFFPALLLLSTSTPNPASGNLTYWPY